MSESVEGNDAGGQAAEDLDNLDQSGLGLGATDNGFRRVEAEAAVSFELLFN